MENRSINGIRSMWLRQHEGKRKKEGTIHHIGSAETLHKWKRGWQAHHQNDILDALCLIGWLNFDERKFFSIFDILNDFYILYFNAVKFSVQLAKIRGLRRKLVTTSKTLRIYWKPHLQISSMFSSKFVEIAIMEMLRIGEFNILPILLSTLWRVEERLVKKGSAFSRCSILCLLPSTRLQHCLRKLAFSTVLVTRKLEPGKERRVGWGEGLRISTSWVFLPLDIH